MPTINQLPTATAVSPADSIPLSQSGTARSASIGTLLASTQPAIIVDSPALLGRISLGSGGPEKIGVGTGVTLTAGTLTATGLDHAGFPTVSSFSTNADLVICNQGVPMLMPAAMLRGLFSAGQNITIAAGGTISATGSTAISGGQLALSTLPVVDSLSGTDLLPVEHTGSNCAITYSDLLGGVTIDEAQPAGPVGDSDTIWSGQGGNAMSSQNFGAIWIWVAAKMPTYKPPVVEITSSINIDTTVHNGRILICSRPVTLTPLTANMGNGFECTVINVSTGNVTLGTGFISSSGSTTISPNQSASLFCATYSGGTIAYAAIAGANSTTTATPSISVPGQVTAVSSASVTAGGIVITWQPPTSGGGVANYTVQYKPSAISTWTIASASIVSPGYTFTGLQAATSYDISVQAVNSAGTGPTSAVLTVVTAAAAATSAQQTVPPQVIGLAATATSSTTIALTWAAQTGTAAASKYTVQYRVTGNAAWTWSTAGITGTSTVISGLQSGSSYDFTISGLNASGSGPTSTTVTAVTQTAAPTVASITWNLAPGGPYSHGSGTIGVNALVSPGTAAIQFGFSQSNSNPPVAWTPGILVNTNLWGAYVPTPSSAGTWFAWAEGTDGSAGTVAPASFVVQ